jgi:hypothetical protein
MPRKKSEKKVRYSMVDGTRLSNWTAAKLQKGFRLPVEERGAFTGPDCRWVSYQVEREPAPCKLFDFTWDRF